MELTGNLFKLDDLRDLLEELGENVRKGYINKLVKNGHPTQENTLASTVTSEVEVHGTTYQVVLNLQEYWKYVEEGTRPHWPPYDAIRRWVEIKPVVPRPPYDSLPRQQALDKIAKAVRWKISQKGTTGTHDLKETEDTLLAYYQERITEIMERSLFDYIEKVAQP